MANLGIGVNGAFLLLLCVIGSDNELQSLAAQLRDHGVGVKVSKPLPAGPTTFRAVTVTYGNRAFASCPSALLVQLDAQTSFSLFVTSNKHEVRDLAFLQQLQNVESLVVSGKRFRCEFLKYLKGHHCLESLAIEFMAVSSADIAHLREIPSVTYLRFYGCTLDGNVVRAISDVPSVEEVKIEACDIPESELAFLRLSNHKYIVSGDVQIEAENCNDKMP